MIGRTRQCILVGAVCNWVARPPGTKCIGDWREGHSLAGSNKRVALAELVLIPSCRTDGQQASDTFPIRYCVGSFCAVCMSGRLRASQPSAIDRAN